MVKLYKLDVGNEKDGELRHMRKKGENVNEEVFDNRTAGGNVYYVCCMQ